MKTFLITVIICLFSPAIYSQKVYDFNATCKEAYAEIIKLKLSTGKELILKERRDSPNNLIPELLEGYIDFFTLFFNEDPSDYAARKDNFDRRIEAFDSGPSNSPF